MTCIPSSPGRPSHDDDRNRPPRPDKGDPDTVLTYSIETIDNDRASYLLGNITI